MTRFQYPRSAFVGFDKLFDELTNFSNESPYPPHNLIKHYLDGGEYSIELAVAGYSKEELDITIEEDSLIVEGKKARDTDRTYLYKGISAKNFRKSFRLAENVKVQDAKFENGLLIIELLKIVPDEKKPKKVSIK